MSNKNLDPSPGTAENLTGDEAAIQGIVDQMQKGWNLKSSEEYFKFFAPDVDYVPLEGVLLNGRRNNLKETLQKIFDSIYQNLDSTYTLDQIRFLSPDVAILNVKTVSHFQNNPSVSYSILMLAIVTKNNGKWEVADYQLTPMYQA